MRHLFLVWLTVCSSALAWHGDPSPAPRPTADDPVAKLKTVIEKNEFTVGRDLVIRYGGMLGEHFLADLAKLRGRNHWIDLGSGEGVAIEDYHKLTPKILDNTFYLRAIDHNKKVEGPLREIAALEPKDRAKVTGITLKMERQTPDYGGKLVHLKGRYFEQIPLKEIGKAELITDVMGVLAYTPHLDQALDRSLQLLSKTGALHVHFPQRMQDNIVRTRDGRTLNLLQWLQTVPGISVTRVTSHERFTSLVIQKTGERIVIPPLRLLTTDGNPPPLRTFEEVPP